MYGFYQNTYNPQPTQDERIWVQNEVSADAYLVAPNGFVRLWDANKQRFYEKRADATGRPMPLEVYEYSRIASGSAVNSLGIELDYAKEIQGLMRRIEALEEVINEQTNADDTGIQQIQTEFSGESKGRGRKAGTTGQNNTEPA